MLETVDLNRAQALDAFVQRHPNGHFMQTSLWGNFRTDWIWRGLICRREGAICGAMACLIHPVHGLKTAIVYAPRGPVVDEDDTGTLCELIQGAKALAKSYGAYLLRMDPPMRRDSYELLGEIAALGFTISNQADFSTFNPRMVYQLDLRGQTEQSLMERFHSKTRYNIRLAQRRGVTIRRGGSEDIPAFYEMMCQTGQHAGFHPRPQQYYADLLTSMPDNARLYCAQLDGEVIAAAICIVQGETGWYLHGCSRTDRRDSKPNDLLQRAMITDCLRQGCRLYDFRGVEGYPSRANPHNGLHRFKQGFGAQLVEYAGQMDLVLRPRWKKLVDSLQRIL